MLEADIKQQLITAEIGTDSTIVVGSVPANPENIIVIGSTQGVLTALENSMLSSKSVTVQKSILFNFAVGNRLNNLNFKSKISKKTLLTFGIVYNLLLLCYFKSTTNSNVNKY